MVDNISLSHQFSDIGWHIQLSNEQKLCISKQTRSFAKIFHKEKHLLQRKVIPMAKFVNQYKSCYKQNRLIGWSFRWLL